MIETALRRPKGRRSVVVQFIFSSLSPSSTSSFIIFPSSELSSSSPGIRNRRALSLDTPSFFCPHVAEARVCWRRDWAEVGLYSRELTEGRVPTKRTDKVVVEHAARQVALVERRVGAAREHREVDHVRESSQHLFVNGAEIDCREIVARERGEHRVSRGENVYKVEPQ